jgi:hypothetical protein
MIFCSSLLEVYVGISRHFHKANAEGGHERRSTVIAMTAIQI